MKISITYDLVDKIGPSNRINRLDEDFWLQYYDGSAWHTVATYVCGTDFNNGEFYNKTLNIDEVNYAFPADIKIRFMCDASDNRDDVYIDEIRVSVK